MAAVDVAFLRATPGGSDLSSEMLLMLALVVYNDYGLFPTPAPPAKRLGSELGTIPGAKQP
jgi:hypothetical protein